MNSVDMGAAKILEDAIVLRTAAPQKRIERVATAQGLFCTIIYNASFTIEIGMATLPSGLWGSL